MRWNIEDKKTLWNGRIFSLESYACSHPGKNVSHDFIIVNSRDWINIVALTEEGKFIMVRQHRLGTDEMTLETTAGVMEHGENPIEAARRELSEETGYQAASITLMKTLSANPAIMNNRIHFFLATGCRKVSGQTLDHAEDIDVELYSRDEILAMIGDGRINHTIIVTALSLYFMFHESVSDGKR